MTAHPDLDEAQGELGLEPGSLLERFKQERARGVTGETVDLRIPGYKDVELVARYRFVDADQTKAIGERVRRQFDNDTDRILHATIDLLVEACDSIYIREPGDRQLVLIDPDSRGPMAYEPRLADWLGFEHASARDIVRGVFRGNDYAITAHGQRLQRWLSDTTLTVDEAALGEA